MLHKDVNLLRQVIFHVLKPNQNWPANRPTSNTKSAKRTLWRVSSKEIDSIPEWKDELPISSELLSPIAYFRKLIDNDLLDLIVAQTNLYATKTNIATNFNTFHKELEHFTDVCFYVSYCCSRNTTILEKKLLHFKSDRSYVFEAFWRKKNICIFETTQNWLNLI